MPIPNEDTTATAPEAEAEAPKPEISEQEVSFYEMQAGMAAREKAQQEGANPHAVEAMANSTSGSVAIGKLTLKPASEGTFITLKKVAKLFKAHADAREWPVSEDDENPGERELCELGLASLVFADARRCFNMLNQGKLEALMAEALDLIFSAPLADQVALKNHIQAAMEEISRLGGEAEEPTVGKPQETTTGS